MNPVPDTSGSPPAKRGLAPHSREIPDDLPQTSGLPPAKRGGGKLLGGRGRTAGGQDRGYAVVAVPLLKEYAEKLDALSQRLLAVWKQKGGYRGTLDADQELLRDGLIRAVKYIKPPLRKWIDASSAAVEEGRLSDTERLELETRLAELEAQYLNILDVVRLFGVQLPP